MKKSDDESPQPCWAWTYHDLSPLRNLRIRHHSVNTSISPWSLVRPSSYLTSSYWSQLVAGNDATPTLYSIPLMTEILPLLSNHRIQIILGSMAWLESSKFCIVWRLRAPCLRHCPRAISRHWRTRRRSLGILLHVYSESNRGSKVSYSLPHWHQILTAPSSFYDRGLFKKVLKVLYGKTRKRGLGSNKAVPKVVAHPTSTRRLTTSGCLARAVLRQAERQNL